MKKSSIAMIVASLLAVVSTFLPWVKMSVLGVVISENGLGLGAVGVIVMIFAVIAVALSVIPIKKESVKRILITLPGVLGLLLIFGNIQQASGIPGVQYGFGIYLAIIAFIFLIIFHVVNLFQLLRLVL